MSNLTFDPAIFGFLQLAVPSYALRLTRAFGARRVGWPLVMAFGCLALLQLVYWYFPKNPEFQAGLVLLFILVPVFLLIGLGHAETLGKEQVRAEQESALLQDWFDRKLQESTAALEHTVEELQAEIARHCEEEEALRHSEAQYRLLFVENPLPIWIFDLRHLRVLAVNEAALRSFGYSREEFMTLNAKELWVPDQASAFVSETSRPCSRPQSRGAWQQHCKDRSVVTVELFALDLNYAGYPARLIVARQIAEPA